MTAAKIINKVLSFIRLKYFYLIFLIIGIAIISGLINPHVAEPLTPLMQFFIVVMIWAICVRIKPEELVTAIRRPKELVYGLLMAFGFFPLLCYILAFGLMSKYPLYAAAFILMGTVPCAGMAGFWTLLLEGDVALAMLLEAIMMILGIITIPVLMTALTGTYVHVNALQMFNDLLILILIPLIIGMLTRSGLERKYKTDVKTILPNFASIAAIMAMLLMFISVAMNISKIPLTSATFTSLFAPSIILFLATFAAAYLLAKPFNYKSRIALTYSTSMKHLPLAIGIAFISLSPQATLPIAIAFIFQSIFANIFYKIFQRISKQKSKKSSQQKDDH